MIFFQNTQNRHSLAHLWKPDRGHLLWAQRLTSDMFKLGQNLKVDPSNINEIIEQIWFHLQGCKIKICAESASVSKSCWHQCVLGYVFIKSNGPHAQKNKIKSEILTHWGRVTHICVSKLTIIGSDNGLSPDRRQAIIWTNAGISSIGPLGTNFSEILIEILTFLFEKMRLKVSSAKRRPFCLGLNVLMSPQQIWWVSDMGIPLFWSVGPVFIMGPQPMYHYACWWPGT